MSTQTIEMLCFFGITAIVVYQFAFVNSPKWAAATAIVSAGGWAVVHFSS